MAEVQIANRSNKFLMHFRFMVTESYDYHEVDKTMMYYGTSLVKESDFPFNFYLLDLPQNTSGLWVKHLVQLWMANMPKGQWPNWLVGPTSPFSSIVINPSSSPPSMYLSYTPPPRVSRLATTTSLELPPVPVIPTSVPSTCCC